MKRAGLLGLAAAALAAGCGRMGLGIKAPAPPPPEDQGLISSDPKSLYWAHGGPGKWFNPWWPNPGTRANLLKWKFLYRNDYAPGRWLPSKVARVENAGDYLGQTESSASITWVGHCTFVVKDGPATLVTDPHFGPRALVYARHHPPGVPLGKVPGDAVAILSHNHYDHMDAWTIENINRDVKWLVPKGLGTFIRERGGDAKELDWWESAEAGGWRLTCLPAQHWSNRIGMERDATLWCSWMAERAGRRYYFGGDSGYFQGYKEFARKFGPIEAAMLPIGAYEPRWMMRYPHLHPEEAYRAFRDLGAKYLVPMHWGTFDLTDEPIDLPPKVLREAMEKAGGDLGALRIMSVGERWHLPG
ncbi:MAG: MBL fold metallo-hydrolase [bacterium]|nr:MBL fold metallo-hydrolase [bacterium]